MKNRAPRLARGGRDRHGRPGQTQSTASASPPPAGGGRDRHGRPREYGPLRKRDQIAGIGFPVVPVSHRENRRYGSGIRSPSKVTFSPGTMSTSRVSGS